MSLELCADIGPDRFDIPQVFVTRSRRFPVDVRITELPKEIHLSALADWSGRIRPLEGSLLKHLSSMLALLMRHLRIIRDQFPPTYLEHSCSSTYLRLHPS